MNLVNAAETVKVSLISNKFMFKVKSRIFRKSFTLLLAAAVLCTPHIIVFFALAETPNEFKSTTIIAPRNNLRALNSISDDGLYAVANWVGSGSPSFSAYRAKTLAQLLVSREVICDVLNRYEEVNNGNARYELSDLRKRIKIWEDPETNYLHINLVAKSALDANFLLKNLLISFEQIQRSRRLDYSENLKTALAEAKSPAELATREGRLLEDLLLAENILMNPSTKEFTVIDAPNIPTGPFSPNIRNIYIASTLLGMVFIFLIARYKET